MSDDSTIVLTDINAALATADKEAEKKPSCLVVVGGDFNGTIFDLILEEITLGRSPDNDISLELAGISRQHLKIFVTDTSVVLQDLGSRNGTYLNNKKVESPEELKKGDIIKLGSTALKFIPKGDPERLTYDKLNQSANTDGLTSCYNKAFFSKALDIEIKKSKMAGSPLSLVIFDLDHFKNLNDNYGHDAGDYVLKELASIVRKNGVREQDVFARYGGEEFVILLPKTNLKHAFEISERLRKLIEDFHFKYDGKRLPVTASVGVADYRQGVTTGTDLFKRADKAVYISKNAGRNQVSFFRE
jgi:diguanylate cyclase (GGDEF)-like protein